MHFRILTALCEWLHSYLSSRFMPIRHLLKLNFYLRFSCPSDQAKHIGHWASCCLYRPTSTSIGRIPKRNCAKMISPFYTYSILNTFLDQNCIRSIKSSGPMALLFHHIFTIYQKRESNSQGYWNVCFKQGNNYKETALYKSDFLENLTE